MPVFDLYLLLLSFGNELSMSLFVGRIAEKIGSMLEGEEIVGEVHGGEIELVRSGSLFPLSFMEEGVGFFGGQLLSLEVVLGKLGFLRDFGGHFPLQQRGLFGLGEGRDEPVSGIKVTFEPFGAIENGPVFQFIEEAGQLQLFLLEEGNCGFLRLSVGLFQDVWKRRGNYFFLDFSLSVLLFFLFHFIILIFHLKWI